MGIKNILNPYWFNKYAKYALKPLIYCQILLLVLGLYYALVKSPPDYQQKEFVRIMYLHVPAAFLSLSLYTVLAFMSIINLVFRIKLAFFIAIASAMVGSCFAAITLITGAIWGKPVWGTWWVWDARLTSMLVLFFIYLIYLAIVYSGESLHRIEKPAGIIAIIGFINIPIVKFSVNLWASLHQPASILRLGFPTIHHTMFIPLVCMGLALSCYSLIMIILQVQYLIRKYSKPQDFLLS